MKANSVFSDLATSIKKYEPKGTIERVGRVLTLGDGVAKISGLQDAEVGELLLFPHAAYGLVLNLEKDEIGAIILGDYLKLGEGDEVKKTGRLLSIPVSEGFVGRVVDPLGQPLDGKGEIKSNKFMALERIAPGVTYREPVNTPLQTGIKAIDSMIPIGRGQRELIIGDRGTGKTAITLDTIINQGKEKSGVICIYVAIGQKASRIAALVHTLEKFGAMKYTIIVAADASMSPALQYLAPYAGCSLGEYFMERGKDAVVFYDDLTKHAWAYRELSLILRRPSGREAYPGDVFYLHSRLLERSCKLDKAHGGGSLTAIPIIETQAGDISAYIPTNVISITDGQIFLENDLFYAGIRPAINVGLSVSRVGGVAQMAAMKKVAGKLRLDMAQYRELSAFAQFASELDVATRVQIEQGGRMVELLKQDQFKPMAIEQQVALIWAGGSGLLSDLPASKMREFEEGYLAYLKNHAVTTMSAIRKDKKITNEIVAELKKATAAFLELWAT